ncbi:MAG: NUDIX domain-containing protein [Pseudonocardiaceae bacterium]
MNWRAWAYSGAVTVIDTSRAAFQVVVFPFRREGDGFVYALLRRQDAGYWQGAAGGGEVGESPLQAARREACEEAGVGDGAVFVVLDARTTVPVVAVTGEFTWGPEVLVIPEYAFGAGVESAELRLSEEHTEYCWFGFDQASKAVKWDSNRTALWELDHRLRHRAGSA